MKICVLASGSSRNCTLVASSQTRILIDAGLSCKETSARLENCGIAIEDIEAICITHEHSDHKASLRALSRRTGAHIYANAGTIEALKRDPKLSDLAWHQFTNGAPFSVGDLIIEPFSVPHDSYDPVGFVIRNGTTSVGMVTDMGIATELIRERLKKHNALILEFNHDEEMLKASGRPWSLIQRIMGRQGHLSNSQAAELLDHVSGPELKAVFLAHLSSDCNTPELAIKSAREVLKKNNLGHVKINIANHNTPTEAVDL
ncbi:MAG: MBL fold metallo-hydrolase [Kiritimatiellae bacterium]|nr:MBL fold metallo-hydrolase [Kiritimatiellia bacterium]